MSGNKVGADQDLEDGLDPESPIYKAIMSNPIVQLGLNNPRSLLGKKKCVISSQGKKKTLIVVGMRWHGKISLGTSNM